MDAEDLERFAELEGVRLLRFAYLVAGRPNEAKDLVQTAYARMLATRGHIENPGPYARRIILNESRHQHHIIPRDPLSNEKNSASPEGDYAERDQMWRALATLTPRQRAVLVLRYYEDLDDGSIAGILQCRRSTVRSLTARGLAILRAGRDIGTYEESERRNG